MRIQALSIGAEVPTSCFSGIVHSVFRRACNLRLQSHELLTLLPSDHGNVPQGIRLNTSSHPIFLDFFRVGQPVACRNGILRIDGSDLSIDLRSARPWLVDLKRSHIDLRRQAQAQCWRVAWSELRTSRRKGGLSRIMDGFPLSQEPRPDSATSEILSEQAIHAIPALLQSTRDFQLEEASVCIQTLIGLGPGLTPSGDDFLVGFLAGLWCTVGYNPSRMRFLLALGAELLEMSRCTNEISGAYLRSAAKGQVSEPIATLAQQMHQAHSMSNVRAATQAALQVGHTSGSDGVFGMLLGCLAWRGLPPHLSNAWAVGKV